MAADLATLPSPIAELTRAMLVAVRKGEWETLIRLEEERQWEIVRLFDNAESSAPEIRKLQAMLPELLEHNARLIEIVQQERFLVAQALADARRLFQRQRIYAVNENNGYSIS